MSDTPQKLGRYETLEEIGKGAMGVVYLARDPLIGRLVALKTFRVGFAARDDELAQFRSRFVREAQSAGILSHPNIVTIHDVVDEGPTGVCFIAMEYVKGTNLKQLLQRPDPVPLGFLINVVAEVAEALDYAHSRGVVHRDIKPANILITPENRVKITDFGIARIESSNLTMEGQLLGTPNYMAPEQIQGREVDHRADIFSLGVVFYEMLTRKKPFQGENMTAVTHKIVFEPFRPPGEVVPDLPQGIGSILSRCLEKDPARRYPRASEVARELRAVLAAQKSLDDTVATQEVEPVAVTEDGAPGGAGAAAGAAKPVPTPAIDPVGETAGEMAPTRLVARPPIPPAPAAAAARAGEGAGEMAPTQLVARPPIPEVSGAQRSSEPASEVAPTRMVARPRIPAARGQVAVTPQEGGLAPTRRVARPPIPAPPQQAAGDADAAAESVPTRLFARPIVPPRSPSPPEPTVPAAPGSAAVTVLSAVPKGGTVPLPPSAPTGASPATGVDTEAVDRQPLLARLTELAGSRQRLAIAASIVAGVVVLVLLGVVLGSGDAARPAAVVEDPAPAPSQEQQSRLTAATAIAEARTQLASGNMAGALQAVARAELAEPGNPETAALREEIESRQREVEQNERMSRIEEGLQAARYAWAERRYADAIAAARGVQEVDSGNVEAVRIVNDAQRALRRLQERQQAIEEAQQRATSQPEDTTAAGPQAATPSRAQPLEALVRVDFASDRSEGVLTIYADDRQILRESFRFVRRTGLLARERVSGTIEASRRVRAGVTTLRVYVALPGEATQAISLEVDLTGGGTRVLEIRIDSAGVTTAVLR